MGTFIDYYGAMEIPEEKGEEFLSRAKQIIDLGGLMDLEEVSMYGINLLLLKPLEISKDTSTLIDFSYFEDDRWEVAEFSGKDMKLYSQKIGTREFNDTITALYSLFALYDKKPGKIKIGGEEISWERSIGWINYLFGTKYCEKDVVPPEEKKNAKTEPFPEVSTTRYFQHLYCLSYLSLPEELKKKPYYIFTDSDRLYWWDGTDSVSVSESLDEKLQFWGRLFRSSLKDEKLFSCICGDELCTSENFSKTFMKILSDINEQYKRIIPFKSMFYEFIENSERIEYKAAVGLLRFLAKVNAEQGKIIEQCSSWTTASKNITFNRGRVSIKQYLAVMANQKLREEYFGF